MAINPVRAKSLHSVQPDGLSPTRLLFMGILQARMLEWVTISSRTLWNVKEWRQLMRNDHLGTCLDNKSSNSWELYTYNWSHLGLEFVWMLVYTWICICIYIYKWYHAVFSFLNLAYWVPPGTSILSVANGTYVILSGKLAWLQNYM